MNEASGNQTYEEVSGQYIQLSDADKASPDGVALGQLRQTLFMGNTLRGLLLYGYAFATIGTIAGIAAYVSFAGALVMLVLAGFGLWHARRVQATEAAPVRQSRTAVQTIIRRRLDDVLHAEGRSVMDVPTSVEWGGHSETVLGYARAHQIDLICTTLAPAHYYFEKFYSAYLGSLLKSSECPILVKCSNRSSRMKDLS
jgi:hypothetical protein